MNSSESVVFQKLKDYREQANRERFMLPENKNIDFLLIQLKTVLNF